MRVLIATMLVAASSAAIAEPHLIYLPSAEAGVDHDAIVQALDKQGFEVTTLANAGENRLAYAKRIAKEVRALMAQGVPADDISVVGAGTSSAVAALTSARVGDRHVNYVLLGQCDPILKAEYNFRMSGRVLGIHDDGDSASLSCRSLWIGSPKVSDRQEIVLDTGFGATLFHEPRAQWVQPLVEWSNGGRVNVGEGARVTQVDEPAPKNTR
ncbi:hypothetical protein QLQ15_10930 [Lysobacter sp. LF1]|uniref:Alpha/beta hydrolase n=1 Tax=Lysobacter stagni TaxID=3045172 RepID=A0ABT6XGY8_9GAMM|nr:hypothetical protein [Lysobacter sp. LF1]MDI9239417.1 hypothetical protein [Lysobacter sp. LF1]